MTTLVKVPTEKSNKNTIQNFIKQYGLDTSKLTKELRKKSVQHMSYKERCEHINRMKLPYGIVRCTPKTLLKRWLGMEMDSIIDVCNTYLSMNIDQEYQQFRSECLSDRKTVRIEKKIVREFFTETSFHISHIADDEVYDWGFFLKLDDPKFNVDEIKLTY